MRLLSTLFLAAFLAAPALHAQEVPAPSEATGVPWGILWGFVFVLSVLALFAGLTQGMGMIFVGRDRAAATKRRAEEAAENPRREHAPAKEAAAGGPPPEILAVIAAAIHVTLHDPVRIVSVRQVPTRNWAAEGRRQIFGSHRVR